MRCCPLQARRLTRPCASCTRTRGSGCGKCAASSLTSPSRCYCEAPMPSATPATRITSSTSQCNVSLPCLIRLNCSLFHSLCPSQPNHVIYKSVHAPLLFIHSALIYSCYGSLQIITIAIITRLILLQGLLVVLSSDYILRVHQTT
jgi:hypothetical protein